jgi:hypothetical protein
MLPHQCSHHWTSHDRHSAQAFLYIHIVLSDAMQPASQRCQDAEVT